MNKEKVVVLFSGTTLNQHTQDNPVSAFKGTLTSEATATDMFLKVTVGGQTYGILLWALP